jgi:ribosome-binding protein aMBF1 (putative translation factor)
MAYDRTALTKSSCESCHRHTAQETLKHQDRVLHVCRTCAKVIRERRRTIKAAKS